MADFKISRIRYLWRGTWTTTTLYNRDDVIRYGGGSWVCIRQHTAGVFATDQTFMVGTEMLPAWTKMTDGYQFRNNWQASTLYNPGDTVLYSGVVYLCLTSHTAASTFAANNDKFTIYTSLINWLNEWVAATRYGIGDLVKYGGIVYRCNTEHTAGTTTQGLENNQASWSVVHSSVEYVGTWTANGARYKPNDLVKYGGSILRCITGHTTATSIVNSNFAIEFFGYKFNDTWNSTDAYAIGDLVRHGGYIYRAEINNANSSPDLAVYQPTTSNWSLISKAVNLIGDWSLDTEYKTGDVVRRGGNLYVAILDTTEDGSSLDYIDNSNWEVISVGLRFRAGWVLNTNYLINDAVNFAGSIYKCNFAHTADSENYPGDNGSGYFYWDLVLLAGPNVAMDTRGDLLTFDYSRTLAGDTSTIGTTSVRVSPVDGEILTINSQDSLIYGEWGDIDKIVYVSADDSKALDDITDLQRGVTYFKPWRTIKFACEYLESLGAAASDKYTVKISTGVYDEILPIIVPAGVALRGEELRSTTVRPNAPIADITDKIHIIAALNRISAMMNSVILQSTLSPAKTSGNSENPVTGLVESYDPPQYSPGTTTELFRPIVGSAQAATWVVAVIADSVQYINYHLDNTGNDVVISSTNTLSQDQNYLDSAKVILANKTFFVAEVIAYLESAFPLVEFDNTLITTIFNRYIDAFAYDLNYAGNYRTMWASRFYRNLVLGSAGEDMFYVRNSTGIRNMTLKGLTGTLPEPVPPDVYSIPTGGSFVSLDPGWGINDNRTWITTRSCYVQNVTTFGTGAIGQKIDGALHAGGNKSIVSNDFTQVISDGIGAWITNGGRAELVSVFSYYCNIGMFATGGGRIRATNGNSSYGNFGAIATGNDPTETPQIAFVSTRLNQATVLTALAGEANDEILLLEFGNAGEQYSAATYEILGSGSGASVVQEEYRDNAIFEFQVRNSFSALGGTPGGGGYSLIGNNAQSGTSTTITLASSNLNTEAELLGLRVTVTSGDGTGQYGYVSAFNDVTKVVTVRKESNGVIGWDHVVPGTPILNALTTSAVYRFEPRLVVDEPLFSSTDISLGTVQIYAGIAYGETTQTFLNIAADVGTGTTIDVAPAQARFNVVKSGRSYTVTLNDAGAGYLDEQELVIDGNLVGGVALENDISITVKSVSNDSTNSILTFEYSGIAASGKFIVTPAAGSDAKYSANGSNWTTTSLPSSGDWRAVSTGENTFVALKYGSQEAARSTNAVAWTSTVLPASRNWCSVAYGSGIFVAIADDSNFGAYSLTGQTWISTEIPGFGDSSANIWVDIAYGKSRFVAVANSGNTAAVGTYVGTTFTWIPTLMDVSADSSALDWVSVAYGNQRFVAISSTGDVGYSFNGVDWLPATMPEADDSTPHNWKKIRYAQGVFFAVGTTGSRDVGGDPTTGPTNFAATSYDGIVWTNRTLSLSLNWSNLAFGNPDVSQEDSTVSNSQPMWVLVSEDTTAGGTKVITGARAKGRIIINSGRVEKVRIWEPGSGYSSTPNYTIVDPNNTSEAFLRLRMGDGVLAQPSWLNRGSAYRTSSTTVAVSGNGYADVIPVGKFITVTGLSVLPGPGAQFRFRGESNFRTVTTIELDALEGDGTFTATFRMTPFFNSDYDLEHGAQVEIRQRYSQVRITGHDFLDIGAGNFGDTNYPDVYTSGVPYFTAAQNEVLEISGGRVFYTSTDQDGNFRAGELFAVEQATGVVTISADFFQLDGLTELALGGVRLGGSGAVIREFSTDPLFTADSNNVIPTQRAIKAYLTNRLNVGGADLLTASFIAGTVRVGPERMANSAGLRNVIPIRANFAGIGTFGRPTGIRGSYLAQIMFIKSFKDR